MDESALSPSPKLNFFFLFLKLNILWLLLTLVPCASNYGENIKQNKKEPAHQVDLYKMPGTSNSSGELDKFQTGI